MQTYSWQRREKTWKFFEGESYSNQTFPYLRTFRVNLFFLEDVSSMIILFLFLYALHLILRYLFLIFKFEEANARSGSFFHINKLYGPPFWQHKHVSMWNNSNSIFLFRLKIRNFRLIVLNTKTVKNIFKYRHLSTSIFNRPWLMNLSLSIGAKWLDFAIFINIFAYFTIFENNLKFYLFTFFFFLQQYR